MKLRANKDSEHGSKTADSHVYSAQAGRLAEDAPLISLRHFAVEAAKRRRLMLRWRRATGSVNVISVRMERNKAARPAQCSCLLALRGARSRLILIMAAACAAIP